MFRDIRSSFSGSYGVNNSAKNAPISKSAIRTIGTSGQVRKIRHMDCPNVGPASPTDSVATGADVALEISFNVSLQPDARVGNRV